MAVPRTIKAPNLPAPPARFCNWPRAQEVMKQSGLDGLVLRLNSSVYYMSGFAPCGLNGSLFETDDSYGTVLISRHAPDHPIVLVPTIQVGYFVNRPTWIADIRTFSPADWGARTLLHVSDTPVTPELEFRRHVPRAARESAWGKNALQTHEFDLLKACRRAMRDLGLWNGMVGFDDLRFAAPFAADGMETVDALDVIRSIREIKTPEEVDLLKQAVRINQQGILKAVGAWQPGMTWNELQHAYLLSVVDQGGFVRDHGAAVINNDPAGDALYVGASEDFELEAGLNVMFDFHGTANHYCWDGGKLWVIGNGLEGTAARIHRQCAEVHDWLKSKMRPGANLLELQTGAMKMIKASGLPGNSEAFITFHGMGLSHGEHPSRAGVHALDRRLESGVVEAIHIWYPGDARNRVYLEDVVHITSNGCQSLYGWSFDPLVSAA